MTSLQPARPSGAPSYPPSNLLGLWALPKRNSDSRRGALTPLPRTWGLPLQPHSPRLQPPHMTQPRPSETRLPVQFSNPRALTLSAETRQHPTFSPLPRGAHPPLRPWRRPL
jgi:hypothetical protein